MQWLCKVTYSVRVFLAPVNRRNLVLARCERGHYTGDEEVTSQGAVAETARVRSGLRGTVRVYAYLEKVEIYFVANDVEEAKKVPVLLNNKKFLFNDKGGQETH